MLEEKIETLTDRLASVETLLKALVSILRKREAAAKKSEAAPASGEKTKPDKPAVAAGKTDKPAETPYTYDDLCVAFQECRAYLTARYEGQQTAEEATRRAGDETIAIVRGVAGNVKNGEHIPEALYGAVIAALRSHEDRKAA